jgi:hypothetical protein
LEVQGISFSLAASLSSYAAFLQTLVTITLVIDTLGIVGDYICVYLVSVDLLYRTARD